MHICLVSGQFFPETKGGAERYVLRIAKELLLKNHDVTVLTTKPFDGIKSLGLESDKFEGIDVLRFFPVNKSHLSRGTGSNIISKALWHGINLANPHSATMAKRALERIQPDVVHTNNLSGISPSVIPVIRRNPARHVHTVHDYSLICPKGNLLREFTATEGEFQICHDRPSPCKIYGEVKRKQVGNPDFVTAPSQHIIDVHEKKGYFTKTTTRCLRLGIDRRKIVSDPSLGNSSPSILFVGNISKEKGAETLIKATRELENVEFNICGSGPYEEELVRAQSDLDNVTYHGYVSDSELERLREEAWAAVVPSLWMDNSPFVVYESFAKGLPVVASDIGGIPELVKSDHRGKLFKPGDIDGLCQAINSLTDPAEAKRMGNKAIDWVSSYTCDAHATKLVEEVYPDTKAHNHTT